MVKDCCSFLFHLSNSFSSLCSPVLEMEKFLENFLCLFRIAEKIREGRDNSGQVQNNDNGPRHKYN